VDRLVRKFVTAVRGRLKSKFATRIFAATDDASLRKAPIRALAAISSIMETRSFASNANYARRATFDELSNAGYFILRVHATDAVRRTCDAVSCYINRIIFSARANLSLSLSLSLNPARRRYRTNPGKW